MILPSTDIAVDGARRSVLIVAIVLLLCTLGLILTSHPGLLRDVEYSLAFLAPAAYLTRRVMPAGAEAPLAPLVAIVGCDGSGKSTLAADMKRRFAGRVPVESCYLGLGSGELGQRIRRLPVIGAPFEQYLAGKAKQTRTEGKRIPGLSTALVVFGFSLMRRRRFHRMLAMRRAGVTVITDRYPQTEVPGFYDGPGLSAARGEGRVLGWLVARERQMYEWMAGHHPDVVVRLNVDLPTAHGRKPDHDVELLARKVAATGRLRFDGAPIVDLDATAPYGAVRVQVERLIDDVIAHASMRDARPA